MWKQPWNILFQVSTKRRSNTMAKSTSLHNISLQHMHNRIRIRNISNEQGRFSCLFPKAILLCALSNSGWVSNRVMGLWWRISWKSARLYSENEVKRVFGFLGQHLSFLSKYERLMALKLSELRKIGSKKREKVKAVRWMKKDRKKTAFVWSKPRVETSVSFL